MILFGGAEVMTGFTHKYTRRAWLRDPETLTTASKSESTATAPGSRRREGSSSPRSNGFGIAIDLLILGWHSGCGFMPSVRRPYGADDCLCPFVDVNVLDADMLVAATTEPTECLHLP